MILIDSIFEKIKIRKMILIYISAIIFTFVILKIPFFQRIHIKDKYFGEVILNMLLVIWFYIMLSKENTPIKSKVINYISKVNYKKIFYLYVLNLGIYIGTGLCILIGDKPLSKVPSGMYIIFGITLAPIVEELIFRGVVMNRLKIKLGIIPAIFFSAAIFGMLHFDLNILGRLLFGILSAMLYIETKNIIDCVILHILHNTSILIFPAISQYTNFSIDAYSEFKVGLLVLIVFSCFILSIVFNIIYIKNNLPRKNNIL